MAADFFLKIDGVDGESKDSNHKGEIEIEAFSWGLSNPTSPAFRGAASSGKVSFQDLHFTMHTNKASPKLFFSCASGQHIKSAILSVRKSSGENPRDYLKFTLTDVLVSSYNTAGSAPDTGGEGGTPPNLSDQFSLSFAKIEFALTAQNEEGGALPDITFGWDIKGYKGG